MTGLVLVFLLTGLSAVLLREDQPAGDCAVQVSAGAAAAQLVARDAHLPEGSEGARRRAVVDAVEGIGGPVGSVATGRFFERRDRTPTVLAYDDRLALVSTPAVGRATVNVVDPDTAATDWRVDLSSSPLWTTFTGGPVGEDLVLAFSGHDPTLLTLDADSAPLGCLTLRTGRRAHEGSTDVRTDQAAADVVVATVGRAPAHPRVVTRLQPSTGRDRWSVDGSGPLASVTVAGGLVLLARSDSATVATEGLPGPGASRGPWVEALHLEDGLPAWELDDASVLLTAGPDATSYLLQTGGGRPRLVAVDAEGRRRWSHPAPLAFRSAWLWRDRLVLRGPDPGGGPMLRAYDTATGDPAWQLRGRQVPPVGETPRNGFGTPLVEDGTAWLPAPNGVVEVDTATGRATRHDSDAPVDQLLRVGDPADGRVVVVSGTALLVTR
jgi:hypothetical protein